MGQLLRERVILLTGASHGIGEALAWGLAREGAELAIVSRTSSEIEALGTQLRSLGRDVFPIAADVSSRPAVEEMAQKALAHYGRIDVLVHGAGVQGAAGPVWEVDPDAWHQTMEINLWGTFLCCRSVLPAMIARRRGAIINISSGAGHSPMAYYSAYSASKAAVTHFTRVLAEEARPYGINVNAIGVWGVSRLWDEVAGAGEAGGATSRHIREMLDAGIRPCAEENVPLVVFLASEAARHITGQYIEANSLPECMLRG